MQTWIGRPPLTPPSPRERGEGEDSNTMSHTRPRIVALARDWLGTPYHHQASLRGVGTDCVGLVRGIWRELYGTEAEAAPAYTRDWAEGSGRETMTAPSLKF